MAKFFWDFKYPERLCPFEKMLGIQGFLLWRKVTHDPTNFIVFAEHDNIYTYDATKYRPKKFLRDENDETGASLPAPLQGVKGRGGSITYHGPGQLVCYLIADFADMGMKGPVHLGSTLDSIIKRVLQTFGIQGYSLSELCALKNDALQKELKNREILRTSKDGNVSPNMSAAGVWVVTQSALPKKIASRGLKIHKYRYGNNEAKYLTTFGYIYPCGLDITITSIKELTGLEPKLPEVAKITAEVMIRVFEEIKNQNSEK
ncbi:MAG: hypothetical protein HYS15_00805 [Candidatus Spechtbacteria bacterium]|nr:hypothetical protein [Candidatus Spechtbacteria bacterium]